MQFIMSKNCKARQTVIKRNNLQLWLTHQLCGWLLPWPVLIVAPFAVWCPDEDGEPDCRETLLHLAGRLGLRNTALFLLTKPGSEEALCIMNREGQMPCAVAAHNGFDHIAELFSGWVKHLHYFLFVLCKSWGFSWGAVVAGWLWHLTRLRGGGGGGGVESWSSSFGFGLCAKCSGWDIPGWGLGMSDVLLLSGILELSFESPSWSPLFLFYPVAASVLSFFSLMVCSPDFFA